MFSACAGAAVYRRGAFAAVGPFDESFFAYLEDIDWGARAQLAGYESRYVPSAVGYHVGGATTSARKGYYGRLQRRNTLLMIAKDFPRDALLRNAWKIVLAQMLWLIASVRDGMLAEHLRAWWEALLLLPRPPCARAASSRAAGLAGARGSSAAALSSRLRCRGAGRWPRAPAVRACSADRQPPPRRPPLIDPPARLLGQRRNGARASAPIASAPTQGARNHDLGCGTAYRHDNPRGVCCADADTAGTGPIRTGDSEWTRKRVSRGVIAGLTGSR